MRSPSAVLFDAYGTLFDVHSVAALAESFFAGQGQALSVVWRDKQIEYSRLVTTSDDGAHYQPFSELTRAGLRYACERLALDLTADREAAMMAQYLRLTPYPEAREVLHALRARGVVTGILSNGDPAMLAPLVHNGGFDGLFDHVISVDAVRRFKTHPEAYALGPQATGFDAADIAFVSSNGWDALAATWYGFRTLWINRLGLPREAIGPAPERTGSSLRDVLSFF
ncbi:haloacid dehalogenase type II [soil metagenome]